MTARFDFDEPPAAEFSPCRTWRYVLRRRWAAGPTIGFVLLNPSTADETQDDPTIRRCIGFARSWGFAGIVLGNIFAFRATDPKVMREAKDPVGPDNDDALRRICVEARVICGWGNHGAFQGRGRCVLELMDDWGARAEALAMTGAGQPNHPLYLSASRAPFPIEQPPCPTA